VNVRLQGDEAAFYRVYQHDDAAQIALVLLNKGNRATTMTVTEFVESGAWRDAFSGERIEVQDRISLGVAAHDARVLIRDARVTRGDLKEQLQELMQVE
jgi:cyclomaltodextrin glucanotransferase